MFKLLNYFALTSLAALLIVVLLMGAFFQQTARSDLVQAEQGKNAALTERLAMGWWPEFAPFFATASQLEPQELRTHPESARFQEIVLANIQHLPVVRVSLSDLGGVVVYSTDAGQVGQEQGLNTAWMSARTGNTTSKLEHQAAFQTISGEREDIDLIHSYVPLRSRPDASVEAVLELYSDVTPQVLEIQNTQRQVVAFVALVLAGLYAALFLIVLRADRILHRQYHALQQTQADLTVARDDAMQANRFKGQLIATVTHDLRTPLSVIAGYVDLIKRQAYGPVTPGQNEVIQHVMRNTRHLADLVNDLSTQAQLESGKLALSEAPFQPHELIDHIHDTLAHMASAKGLSLECRLDPALPKWIMGDVFHLKQILTNLTGNAVKFTQQGGVQVSIAAQGSQRWSMAVADTGPGIPEEAQARIFEAYEKLNSSETGNVRGWGLGLSIVKQIATLMGGEVRLQSQLGAGSTFTVELPLVPVENVDFIIQD